MEEKITADTRAAVFPDKAALTIREAAELLGVGYNTMNELTWQEGFPVLQLGRKKLIPKDAFLEWLNSQKRQY